MASITGTNAPDSLQGTSGNGITHGLEGNDSLFCLSTLVRATGSDTLDGASAEGAGSCLFGST